MAQRGIPETWGREALAAPEQVVEGHGGRQVVYKRMTVADKKRLLRILYEETETTLVAVTAYLTSAITRYWRETS
jgi:hypothetical protein